MKTKPFLIAAAAFAVTATGVYAQGNAEKILERANLSEEQKSALSAAHELRKAGDTDAARDKLIEAGVDEGTLHALRSAGHEVHAEIKAAVEAGDYEAFKAAAEGTPMEEQITSQDLFDSLVEAHNLREDGDYEGAREIMDELGLKPRGHMKGHFDRGRSLSLLSDEQKDALQEARRSNDKEAAQAILDDAGIEFGGPHHNR